MLPSMPVFHTHLTSEHYIRTVGSAVTLLRARCFQMSLVTKYGTVNVLENLSVLALESQHKWCGVPSFRSHY